MKIPVVKILDYKLNQELKEKLETSTNPMSMIVRAQLKSLEIKKVEEELKMEYIPLWERDSHEEGIKIGVKEGRKEEKIEIAKKLKEKGIDVAVISETSGLSKEEIEKL